jgi:hypothetical protein
MEDLISVASKLSISNGTPKHEDLEPLISKKRNIPQF